MLLRGTIRFRTIAETLRDAGFSTHAVVASFPVAGRFGFDQGFDHYVEDFDRDFLEMEVWEDQPLGSSRFYSLADTVTDHAIAALDEARAPRQFGRFEQSIARGVDLEVSEEDRRALEALGYVP